MNILFIIILIIIIIEIINYFYFKDLYREYSNYCGVFQFNSSFDNYENGDPIMSPFNEILDCSYVKSFKDANIILFSDFTLIDQNIKTISFNKFKYYYVYGIMGSDDMANKIKLAEYLMLSGNKDKIPITYILENKNDIEKLKQKYYKTNQEKYNNENKDIYILKKNIQRQEGLLITDDINKIINNDDKYLVAQELLQNPFIINKRKINMRIYMLVVIKNNNIDFYIYNNGFIYYSPKEWKEKSIENDINITTGYIDRQIYIDNPLTHFDLYKYIGDEKSSILQKSILNLFKNIKLTYETLLLKKNKSDNIINFNIYGCDIAPDNNLNTKIIEINKGPDLTYKDERDRYVKYNLVKDCLEIINNNYNKNYIKL